MSDLPVARCGDCLYGGDLDAGKTITSPGAAGFCKRRAPSGDSGWCVIQSANDWCGEFIHRKLGEQFQGIDYEKVGELLNRLPPEFPGFTEEALREFFPHKQWRFPTEEG